MEYTIYHDLKSYNQIEVDPDSLKIRLSYGFTKYIKTNDYIEVFNKHLRREITSYDLLLWNMRQWCNYFEYDQGKYRPPKLILLGKTNNWLTSSDKVEFYICLWIIQQNFFITHTLDDTVICHFQNGEISKIDYVFPEFWMSCDLEYLIEEYYNDLCNFAHNHCSV